MLSGAGCKKTVGDALRPDETTAAAATGQELTCPDSPVRIKPLVVDWQPDERVDLEAAMGGTVVVVRYDCPRVEILPGCTVDGSYSYAGTSRKEQVIQMQNMDQIKANIPISSGSVGGEVSAGRAINLATVYVGRRSTTVNYLNSGDLQGQCDGATHFVRSASLGAFSMATGTKGKAAVVAEMFGVGAGASSDSERNSLNSDGSLESCRGSSPADSDPPDECRAPVKIELMPIAQGAAGEGAKAAAEALKKGEAVENTCIVPGYVEVDGMCQPPASNLATICEPDDKADCAEQCDKGSMESCYNLGRLNKGDLGAAQIPLNKACKGGVGEACSLLGDMIWMETDPDQVNGKAMAKSAYDFLVKGCDAGDGYGCEIAGDIVTYKELTELYNQSKAYSFYARSCDLGRNYGCYEQGQRLLKGDGTTADPQAGVSVWARSCEGGSADECESLAGVVVNGKFGVPKNTEIGVKLYMAACALDVGYCEDAGKNVLKYGGDIKLAVAALTKDCDKYKDSDGCGRLGQLYIEGKGVPKDPAKGRQLLAAACDNGEGYDWACDELKK